MYCCVWEGKDLRFSLKGKSARIFELKIGALGVYVTVDENTTVILVYNLRAKCVN